ncbi:STAS domain-containing protein [Streptomyces sp. NPDC059452]|uniref:STAS domain-containing protein n=1 Tax=Streptomyces sp. NPDC059452 TaxID=3346835 RepID=UPI00369009F9
MEAKSPIVLTVTGRVGHEAVPGLCADLERRLAGPVGAAPGPAVPVECDVGGTDRADLVLVEAVARLALVARRSGRRLRLRGVSPELQALLDLVGLGDVVALEGPQEREGREEGERPEDPEGQEEREESGERAPGPY